MTVYIKPLSCTRIRLCVTDGQVTPDYSLSLGEVYIQEFDQVGSCMVDIMYVDLKCRQCFTEDETQEQLLICSALSDNSVVTNSTMTCSQMTNSKSKILVRFYMKNFSY